MEDDNLCAHPFENKRDLPRWPCGRNGQGGGMGNQRSRVQARNVTSGIRSGFGSFEPRSHAEGLTHKRGGVKHRSTRASRL